MKENTTVVAVDIAKAVFQLAISESPDHPTKDRRLRRSEFLAFFEGLPLAIVAMEACGSAHYWAREIQALGHTVELIPPHLVRPYVPRNKTDRADARAILEARRNRDIHLVPIKSVPQQVLGAMHRFRSGWIGTRTAQVNTIRGLLRELGILIPVGVENVVPQVRLLIEERASLPSGHADSKVPELLRPMLAAACDEVELLDRRIKQAERQLEATTEVTPHIATLRSIPGVGLITSTALTAFVGDVGRFKSGRRFASYLGLTPNERSSGTKRRLGGISKRGDRYLRTLLIHGARSVICHAKRAKSHDHLRAWVLALQSRSRHNKAAVALANKIARIIWATWKNGRPYESRPVPKVA
jgi:transposase